MTINSKMSSTAPPATKTRRRKKSGKPTTPPTNTAKPQPPQKHTTKPKKEEHKTSPSKTPPPPTATATATMPIKPTNKYVQTLDKKLRKIKKKLKKASETAAAKEAGKTLTEQQEQQLQRLSDWKLQCEEWSTMKELFLGFAADDEATATATALLKPPRGTSKKGTTATLPIATTPPTPPTTTTTTKKKKQQSTKKEEKSAKTTKTPTKPTAKTTATSTTRVLTAETGTSFNGPNHLLDNVIKCLVVANLVRHHTDPKCQRVVQCADLLAGDTSGRGHKNNAPSMDVLFERARTHAQEFSPLSLQTTETSHVLRAVDIALDAIKQEEVTQEKIAQAKSVLGQDAGAFNFFAADEEDEAMSINEVAARAIRSMLE